MRKYYNAGGAGRNFSRLEIGTDISSGLGVEVLARELLAGETHLVDVRLNVEQVRDLHLQLGAWLKKYTLPVPPPTFPMIEGSEI